jgi:hypothetical protein
MSTEYQAIAESGDGWAVFEVVPISNRYVPRSWAYGAIPDSWGDRRSSRGGREKPQITRRFDTCREACVAFEGWLREREKALKT